MIISFLVSPIALIRDHFALMHLGLRDVRHAVQPPRLSPSHESILIAVSNDLELHNAVLALFEGDDRGFWNLQEEQRAVARRAAKNLGNVPLRPIAR